MKENDAVLGHFLRQTINDLKPRILAKTKISAVKSVCYICGFEKLLVAIIKVLNKEHTPYVVEELYICEECEELIGHTTSS